MRGANRRKLLGNNPLQSELVASFCFMTEISPPLRNASACRFQDGRTPPASPGLIRTLKEDFLANEAGTRARPRRLPSHRDPTPANASRTSEDTRHHRETNQGRCQRITDLAARRRRQRSHERRNRWAAVPTYDGGASVGHGEGGGGGGGGRGGN